MKPSHCNNSSNFFTVLAYARYLGIKVNRSQAIRIGQYASKKGKAHNIPPIDVPDIRYGFVKAHYETFLKEAFVVVMGISINQRTMAA